MTTHLTIRARLEDISIVSNFVMAAAQKAGLDEQGIHHCQLAVDEACTNIIEHAYGENDEDEIIQISCKRDAGGFHIVIVDHGPLFNPLGQPAPDPAAALDERRVGGWGIYFIKKLMDEVRYDADDGRNRLTCTKFLDSEKDSVDNQPVAVRNVPGSVQTVTFAGRIDKDASTKLENLLTSEFDAGHNRVVVDLSDVDYISSSGLKMLVAMWKRAHDLKGDLMLAGLRPPVREVINLIGFDLVFRIFDSVDEALKRA